MGFTRTHHRYGHRSIVDLRTAAPTAAPPTVDLSSIPKLDDAPPMPGIPAGWEWWRQLPGGAWERSGWTSGTDAATESFARREAAKLGESGPAGIKFRPAG